MSTRDFNVRMNVTGAPGAKQQVKGVKDELLATGNSAEKANQSRTRNHSKAEDDINRRRGLAVQQEIQAQRRAEAEGRASLHRRLSDFKRAKADEERIAEQTRRREQVAQDAALRRSAAAQAQHSSAMLALMRRQAQLARQASGGGPGGLSGSGPGGAGGGAGAGGSGVASGAANATGVGLAMRYGARALAPVAAGKIVIDSVQAFADIESLEVALEMLFGSAAKAKTVMAELFALANKTGVGVERFAKAATTMNGFGVEADKIVPKLRQIAIITRGSAERMDRLSLAFAQSAGQGRLMAEELNQMIDAGFNPLLQISKDTGMSVVQLRKVMKDGKLDFDLLSQAMDNLVASGGKYDGMMEAMEKTTSVRIAKMTTAWTNLYRAIGTALSSDTSKLGSATGTATSAVTEGVSALGQGIGIITSKAGNAQENAFEGAWKRQAEGGSQATSSGISAAREALKLEKQINEANEKRAKADEDAARKKKADRAAEEKYIKTSLMAQAQQVRMAYQFTKIQIDGAKDFADRQKKVLETIQKQVTEAQKNLVKGVQGFSEMSGEEKQAALKTLEKARSGKQLTFEETDKLEAIGSKEAKKLAEQQRLKLASGQGFDALGQQAYEEKVRPLDQQLEALKQQRLKLTAGGSKEYSTMAVEDASAPNRTRLQSVETGRKIYSKREQDRIEQVDRQIEATEMQKQQLGKSTDKSIGENRALYENVFGQEQEQIRKSITTAQQVTANIKQTIEFKANYEDSAKQIGEQVMQQVSRANDKQMKDILTFLKPLMEQVNKDRMTNIAKSNLTNSR